MESHENDYDSITLFCELVEKLGEMLNKIKNHSDMNGLFENLKTSSIEHDIDTVNHMLNNICKKIQSQIDVINFDFTPIEEQNYIFKQDDEDINKIDKFIKFVIPLYMSFNKL